MYFTVERLAAERVADFRREAERSGAGRQHRMPRLVRALLGKVRGGAAALRPIRPRLADPVR
jgi:hypothetical protein